LYSSVAAPQKVHIYRFRSARQGGQEALNALFRRPGRQSLLRSIENVLVLENNAVVTSGMSFISRAGIPTVLAMDKRLSNRVDSLLLLFEQAQAGALRFQSPRNAIPFPQRHRRK